VIGQDEAFPAAYEAEALDDWPGAGFDFHFVAPGASSRASGVLVHPYEDASWSASVAGRADGLHSSFSGLFPTPDPGVLCVVERGTAFLVDVREPAKYEVIPTEGAVSGAIPVRRCGLLLLTTAWSITAVGERGVVWTTSRIAVEGLRADELDEGWLRGVADPDGDEPRDFAVELSSGQIIGGAGLW
jgi:hypothetical protein